MTHPSPSLMRLLSRVYAVVGNSYFDDHGRLCQRIPSTFTDEDRRQLVDAGLVPNVFVTWTHDEAVSRLRQAAAAVDLRRAAEAFVASMVSADPAWLAVLPACALGRAMPEHACEPMDGGTCRVCFHEQRGVERSEAAYFRHLCGAGWGVHGPTTGALALAAPAEASSTDWPVPTPRDIWVFHRLLALLRGLPATARYSQARTVLKKAAILRSDHPARSETVLEALAFIGVLQTPEHPGLLTRFTTAIERDRRPSIRVEVPAPLAWWTAAHGINEALVTELFGHLGCPHHEPPAPAAEAAVRPRKAPQSTARPKSIPGAPTAGSIYAIRYREDLWGAAYCHEVRTDERGVLRGRIEYLDLLSSTPPTAAEVQGLAYRDRLNGERFQAWCGGLDKTVGVKRVAVDVPAPVHQRPAPERLTHFGARELVHMAAWNFQF